MLALWIAWGILTVLVISLAVFRRVAARKEDEYVHLAESEVPAIQQQVAVAHKLDRIDTVGKTLTVVDIAFGVVLVGLMFYNAWHQSMEAMQ